VSLEWKIRLIYVVICITCYSYSGFEVVCTIQCLQSSWSIYSGCIWSHSIHSGVINANPQLYKSGAHNLALYIDIRGYVAILNMESINLVKNVPANMCNTDANAPQKLLRDALEKIEYLEKRVCELAEQVKRNHVDPKLTLDKAPEFECSKWKHGLTVHVAKKHQAIPQFDGNDSIIDDNNDDAYEGSEHFWKNKYLGGAYQYYIDAMMVLQSCRID